MRHIVSATGLSSGEHLAMCGYVFPSYRAAVDAGHAIGNYIGRADTLSAYHARGIDCKMCIVRHADRSGGTVSTPATKTPQEAEAYELGKQAAIAAASWVIDGNTPTEHIARMVAWLDDGDPRADEFLPARPDLSGEWADEATPQSLAQTIYGAADWELHAYTPLCDAWEQGVDDYFIVECERILRGALPDRA